jgi:hypothetical protein
LEKIAFLGFTPVRTESIEALRLRRIDSTIMPKQRKGGSASTGRWSLAGKSKGKKDDFEGSRDAAGVEGFVPGMDELKWRTVKIDDALRGEAGLVTFEELDASEIAHLLPNKPAAAAPTKDQAKKGNKRKRGKETATTVHASSTLPLHITIYRFNLSIPS